jgi:hypothetical protein
MSATLSRIKRHKNFNYFRDKLVCMHVCQKSIVNSENSFFNLGMFTYSYESLNIIQIALKRQPGE